MGWMADTTQAMAILNDRSQGCSSLSDGAFEFMIHRRLVRDDGRGVGEPLDEPGTDGQGLTVTGTHYLIFSSPDTLASAARQAAVRVFASPYVTYTPLTTSIQDYLSSHNVQQTFLQTSLPVNVELITFQVHDAANNIAIVRLAHQFGIGEDKTLSNPVTVDLGSLFVKNVVAVTQLTLTANQKLGTHKGYTWKIQGNQPAGLYESIPMSINGASFNVTIQPAEILTFNVTFSPSPAQLRGAKKILIW